MQPGAETAALQGRCSKGGAGDPPVTALGLRAPVASQGHATHSHRTPRSAPALPHTSPASAPTARAAHGKGRSRSSVSLRECGPGLPAGGRGFMPVSHAPGLRTMHGNAWEDVQREKRLSNASPGSVLQKLKFSLSCRNAGLGRVSPFPAQDTGFPDRAWSAPPASVAQRPQQSH